MMDGWMMDECMGGWMDLLWMMHGWMDGWVDDG